MKHKITLISEDKDFFYFSVDENFLKYYEEKSPEYYYLILDGDETQT